MSKVFVISDTWFNRPLDDEQHVNIVDNNNFIISNWNEVVGKDDIVYVLGGFGISDLYHIVVKLNGEIHFLNNYFNDDEKKFINEMGEMIDKSNDETLIGRIIFENKQVMSLPDQDCIISYFPLSDWCGKSSGTFCFHGYDDMIDILGHNISCTAPKWEYIPIDIQAIKESIQEFQKNI